MPRCWPILTIAAMTASTHVQGQDTLVFGTAHDTDSVVYQYASEYLQLLCGEIHQRCQLQNLPGRRSEAMLADGSLAGEMGRVKDYGNKYPGYQRIEDPFVLTRTYIFTPAGKPVIESWDALIRQARTVSYKRGIFTYQTRLEALRPRIQPHDVQSVPACLQMVINGRDQACIYDDGSLSATSRAMLSMGGTGKPLEELGLYIYLSPDRRALAPAINAAARHLHAKGIAAELRRKYFLK
jgi:ABC-type amino acid transport substrate-binding protein